MSHPVHEHPRFDHRTSTVPLACHFDGVTSIHCGRSWGKNVEAGSFTSLLSKQAAASIQNLLMFNVFKIICTTNTMERIWTELIWSLYWAYQGIWPDRDSSGRKYTPADGWRYEWRGQPLCGGYIPPTFLTRVDLEWLWEFFWFGDYKSGKAPCGLCPANDTDPLWTDCRKVGCAWSDYVGTMRLLQQRFQIGTGCLNTFRA